MVVDPKDIVSVMMDDIHRTVEEQIKPGDRSEKDRHCAIFLTDLEKLQAYFEVWIKKAR
jgi:hypothetical protein